MSAEQNLLFGVLALQSDLIDATRFAEACSQWAARKSTPLAEILVERGWISAADRAAIERLASRRLQRFGGDAKASLAATLDSDQLHGTEFDAPPDITTPSGQAAPAATLHWEDDRRARYTVTRLCGEGGLGRVWLARDEDLKRQVALKEIQPKHAEHPDSLQRFLQEAQITGQLEHPNIVPVYELGRRPEDGQPFYTMRFVRGRTLHDAIGEYHRHRGANQADPLELPRLLRAFIAVCNAVGYAHSRGVIHRDLKPSNVVLGGFGEVIVLDWGLAKLAGTVEREMPELSIAGDRESSRTVAGRVLGSPAYMAPEQADGRIDLIDARTDVYGLGAMLYAILTGRAPHAASSTAELLQHIVHGETPRARAVDAAVPAALDAIAHRAMAKDRNDRYAQAADLADDVERWLQDEPVAAYREPTAARLGRWGRRHKSQVAGAAAVLVATVIALAISTTLIAREQAETDRERQRAEDARIQAELNARRALEMQTVADSERLRAEDNFQRARDAVDQMLTRVGDERLRDIPHMETLRQKLLEDALQFNRQFLQLGSTDPAVRLEASHAHRRLGDIHGMLQKNQEAEQDYRDAIALGESLTREFSDRAEYRQSLAGSMLALATLLHRLGRFDDAERYFEQSLRLREPGAAASASHRAEAADTLLRLASLHAQTGRHAPAEDGFRQAVNAFETLVDQAPTQLEFQHGLARALKATSAHCTTTNRLEEGEQFLRRAIQIRQQLTREQPSAAEYREALCYDFIGLADLTTRTGRRDEGETAYNDALAIARQLAADFPSVPDYRLMLASVYGDRGVLLIRSGKLTDAEQDLRESIAIVEKLVQDFPSVPLYRRRLGFHINNLANIMLNSGRLPEAIDNHRVTLAIRQKLVDEFPTVQEYRQELGVALNNLGADHTMSGDYESAARWYAEANRVREALVAEYPQVPAYRYSLALGRLNAAIAWHHLNRFADAETSVRNGIALLDRLVDEAPTVGTYRASAAEIRGLLAEILCAAGRPDDAHDTLHDALPLHEKLIADFPKTLDNQRNKAIFHNRRAELHEFAGSFDLALAELSHSIAICTRLVAEAPTNTSYNEVLVFSLCARARTLLRQFRRDNAPSLDDAVSAAQQALEIVEPIAARSGSNIQNTLGETLTTVAKIAAARSLHDDAQILLDRARSIQQSLRDYRPAIVRYASNLAETLTELAALALARNDLTSARKLLDQARPLHRTALDAQPLNPYFIERQARLEAVQQSLANQ